MAPLLCIGLSLLQNGYFVIVSRRVFCGRRTCAKATRISLQAFCCRFFSAVWHHILKAIILNNAAVLYTNNLWQASEMRLKFLLGRSRSRCVTAPEEKEGESNFMLMRRLTLSAIHM